MHNKILDIQYWLTVTEEQLQKKKKKSENSFVTDVLVHP